MKHILAFAVVSSTLLPACASLAARSDAMCAPLRAFAASVAPGESRSVVFNTIWGTFRDDPVPAINGKRCSHEGYAPAKAVCSYLMEHGATEFSGNNVKRAVSCLSPASRFDPEFSINQGHFSLRYGTPDRGSHITVEFVEDVRLGGMALILKVDGY